MAKALDVEPYYGKNLDALWDLLGFGVKRPLTIIWQNSSISKLNMAEDFEKIINVLERIKEHDELWHFKDKFNFILQ